MTRKLPLDVPGSSVSAPRASNPGAAGSGHGGGRERHPPVRPQAPRSGRRDEMGPGLMVSAVVHTAVVVLILLGLPDLFKHEPPPEVSIAVTLVNPAKETRTTARNQHPKAEAPPIPPPPIPAEKPLPPIPDPLTPPPAPPPPPKTEAAPPPPVPQAKPETPPPPPPKLADLPKPEPAVLPPPPKPDLPKPPPPKPEPPKPVAKTEPPKPNKADEDFDSLLNTLAKPAPQKAVQPPKPQKQQPQAAAASSLANAPLGSQITTSEKDTIAAAVSPCWDVDAGAKGASDMQAVIQVEVNPDGTVRNTTILDTEGRGGDPIWRAFAERARRAPLIPACNKLPIPPDKYEQLKVFTFTFTPQGVL